MIVISRHVAIPDGELEITAIRAQGAGGQHVNKTSTAIHLRFDIRASSLPEYYKERLLAASHHLISSDGVIKDLTTEQKARRPTRPTRASKERRLASKAQKSSVKAMRGKVRSGRE